MGRCRSVSETVKVARAAEDEEDLPSAGRTLLSLGDEDVPRHDAPVGGQPA